MCFSTTASFTAGIILSSTSIVAIKNSKTTGQKFFGFTPLFFGVQQLVEGFVWLSLKNPELGFLNMPATYMFLFFAQVFWPTFVPLAIQAQERDKDRKRILSYLTIMGMISSTLLLSRIAFYPVYSAIDNHHIIYTFEMPYNVPALFSLLYIIPTVIPAFISTTKKMLLLGTLITSSLIITKLVYGIYTLSVWCFFAAIISVLVIYIIRRQVVEDEEQEMRSLVF